MTPKPDTTFEPPGPGTWMLDTQHYPKPMSRFDGRTGPALIASTMTDTSERYGLLGTMSGATVNGFMYMQRGLAGVTPGSTDVPSVDQPEIRERIQRARHVLQTKYWREEYREFHETVKPDSIKRNLALASLDVASMSDDQLIQHVEACRENLVLMRGRHHQFNTCATLPIGLFLADVQDWTGIEPVEVAPIVSSASPISVGVTPQLTMLVEAIRGDDTAQNILSSEAPGDVKFTRLRELSGPVGEAAERYALIDGHWLATGFDLTDLYALELPEILMDRISKWVDSGTPSTVTGIDEEVQEIRIKVPEEHREAFDAGLAEARAHLEIKDERGLYQDMWAKGITRKAALELGFRLQAKGLLNDAEHIFEAEWSEFDAGLVGTGIPADELAERREARMSLSWRDAPPILGPPPSPPELPEGLPEEMMILIRASGITGPLMGMGRPAHADPIELSGMVASRGTYEGTARVAVGDYDFDLIQPGDVLVTSTHSEAYTGVSSRVGAIVTDTGGVLSHLSVISREMGIPSIVACHNATIAIKDGDRILVDAENGIVTILEPAG